MPTSPISSAMRARASGSREWASAAVPGHPAILGDELADLRREQHGEVLRVVELRPVALGDKLAQLGQQRIDVGHGA